MIRKYDNFIKESLRDKTTIQWVLESKKGKCIIYDWKTHEFYHNEIDDYDEETIINFIKNKKSFEWDLLSSQDILNDIKNYILYYLIYE